MHRQDFQILRIFAKNKLVHRKTPVHVSFQTTTACNLECSYCYADAKRARDNELNTEEAKRLFLELKKMNIFLLALTGGEPLLRSDIYELVEFCSQIELATCLATNGILLSMEKAKRLKNLGLSRFLFSLDGSCEEVHSKTRGKASFEKILEGIENAVSTDLPVSVQTMITKYNREDLDNIAVLLKNKKVMIWRLQIVIPCGRGINLFPTERLTQEEILGLMERVYLLANRYKKNLKINFHDLPIYKAFLYKKAGFNFRKKFILWLKGGCGAIEGAVLYINSDGSIRPCPHFPYVLPEANLRTQSIIDIYRRNSLLQQLRNRNNLRGECRACRYTFCCGGCRANSFVQTGNFFGTDTNCPFS